MKLRIRQGTRDDFPMLSALWRRSVEATHDFLSCAERDAIHRELEPVYFPSVTLWIAEDEQGICGFMGLNANRVEMLFVEPSRRNQGVGSFLLNHANCVAPVNHVNCATSANAARDSNPVRTMSASLQIDVNEQNPAAWGFYRQYGFRETGRSELDGQGRPFPLIHMEYTRKDVDEERCGCGWCGCC